MPILVVSFLRNNPAQPPSNTASSPPTSRLRSLSLRPRRKPQYGLHHRYDRTQVTETEICGLKQTAGPRLLRTHHGDMPFPSSG